MFKNYLKTLLRNIRKNKTYSLINITGLSIGMAAAILILLWIQNEMSIERFHEKGDRLYLMYNRDKDPEGKAWAWPNTPKVMATTLRNDYPEVEDAVRYWNITFLVTAGEKKLNQRGAFVDSGFLKMFSFPLLQGDKNTALNSNHNIVLTESFATALFGKENAMGKIVRVDSVHNCTVTGVLKDLPNNTRFEFAYLLPWSYVQALGWNDQSWGNNSVRTYTLLKEGALQPVFDNKVKNITIDHTKESANASTTEVFTHPIGKVHLYGKSEDGKLVGGQVETVRLFAIIAGFILLIACINFMNLSTARSEKRAKEVGIRKVSGAGRRLLIFQFLGESIFLCIIAFAIALLLVQLALPGFNELVGKKLFINYTDSQFWIYSLAFILCTGLLAGSYPAFYLSSFNPIGVLKGKFKQAKTLVAPRKVLVAVQFTFAIILIIGTVIVVRQIRHGLDRQTGYDRNNLIYVFTQGDIEKHYLSIKNELLGSGAVTSLTSSANPITQRWSDSWGYYWEGSTKSDEKIDFLRLGTDADFVKTIGVTLLQGRDIDIYKYATDSTAVMLNEAAVKAMRVKDPVGMTIKEVGGDAQWHVVGVIKDFVLESPYQQQINPMMIFGPGGSYHQVIHAKLNSNRATSDNISIIEKIFKKYNPQYPVDYVFADESYARKFQESQRTGKLAALFAGLTILISCLGLFGLAAYMAESRTKEVGVRKVLGASVVNVALLLSKEFLWLVGISFCIASPVAWYVMNKWLDNYSYRIGVEWWVFALAGITAIVIALATVSYQAIKAAMANPVKSLRTE